MKSLGEYIKSNKNIEEIGLGSTNISDAGIEILAPYLDGSTTFRGLYLANSKGITDKSIPHLLKIINTSFVDDISIGSTSIAQKNIVYISVASHKIKNGLSQVSLHGK